MKLELITREAEGDKKGKSILFIHGMWHGAWCWDEFFMPYFASAGYDVYALSLRGHGKSEGKKGIRWHSISDYVADVENTIADIGENVFLVGHSMGAFITQKYLENNKAPGAVLLASAPVKGLIGATLRVAKKIPIHFLKANFKLSMYEVISTPDLARETFFSDNIDPALLDKYFSQMEEESYRAYLDIMMLNLPKPKKVDTPMLVLAAENDTAISKKDNLKTAAAYHTEVEFFEDMAHDMMLEKEWQKVADRIIKWLGDKQN